MAKFSLLVILTLLVSMMPVMGGDVLDASLERASKQGVFQIAGATAALTRANGAWQLKFSLPAGSATGVWAQYAESDGFPPKAQVLRYDYVVDAETPLPLRVSWEIKGATGVQRVPLILRERTGTSEVILDTPRIGAWNETVFVVAHPGGTVPLSGGLTLKAQWVTWSPLRRVAGTPWGQWLGLLLAAFLAAGLSCCTAPRRENEGPRVNWLRDLGFALACLLGSGSVLALLASANTVPGRFPLTPVAVALAGAVMAALFNRLWAGRWPTAAESFRHVLIPGLLTLAASDISIWTAASGWSHLGQMTRLSAVVFWLLYHWVNIRRLRTTQHPVDAVMGMRLVAIPFLFGLLLLLPNRDLMLQGGSLLLPGVWGSAELRILIMRMLVLAGFNLLSAMACGGANGKGWGRGIWDRHAAFILTITAISVTVSPIIANMGSGLYPLPRALQPLASLFATMVSQGLLWAEAYLLTGMLLDAMHRRNITGQALIATAQKGFRNGLVFGGWFMGLLHLGQWVSVSPFWVESYSRSPFLSWAVLGGAVFPLIKTIIESFDGSPLFLRRLVRNYRRPALALRGAIAGLFIAWSWTNHFIEWSLAERMAFGFTVGALLYAGISLASDTVYRIIGRGRFSGLRLYGVEILLGGVVGAALGFYFDATQTPVVAAKLGLYHGFGMNPVPYDVYPLLSRWGFLGLGEYAGGARLLWNEALAGVISWGVAAWLFAINRSFLMALFQREWAPVRRMATREGLAELADGTIFVLRWGLWMAPVIFTFLRQMPVPTWYNQDGAIRTLFCVAQTGLLDPAAFEAWSLKVFTWVLAYDAFRVLIWLDHMGLRVATLVNLSFLGMDRLDERVSRFLGPHAAARFIPEGIKRFTTWAPLLLPFYIPAGAAWNQVWDNSKALQLSSTPLIEQVWALSPSVGLLAAVVLLLGFVMLAALFRALRKHGEIPPHIPSLDNTVYSLSLHRGGALRAEYLPQNFDVHRRSYEGRDPAGRAMFIVEPDLDPAAPHQVWPVLGNYPAEIGIQPRVYDRGDDLRFRYRQHGVEADIVVTLPDEKLPLEAWSVTVRNFDRKPRTLFLVPYVEWSLNSAAADRGHTQYNRLFPEVSYLPELNTIMALHHTTKLAGFLSADRAPEGINVARVEFIGRAGTLWAPEGLREMHWRKPEAMAPCPMFDSIASMALRLELPAGGEETVRLWVGCATSGQAAEAMIKSCCPPGQPRPAPAGEGLLIGHGYPPGAAGLPYTRMEDGGRVMRVLTPFTPRPFDHTLANRLGHVVSVTNRGLHTSSSVNSQQNRLTPDWADTTTRELPGEAIYLYDRDQRQWMSPAYEPLRVAGAEYETEFRTDGTAVFHMRQGTLGSELTVFVPPDEPLGVYLLKVRNDGDRTRHFYCAPYFQMTLAAQPEHSGVLMRRSVAQGQGWLFTNPRNTFRSGPAFVAVTPEPETSTTRRGEFFGANRTVAHPIWVEGGTASHVQDHQAVAAFRIPLDIPPHAECEVVVILGQVETEKEAEALIARYAEPGYAAKQLEATRGWWNRVMGTLTVATADQAMDGYLYWLRYQALAERLWARKGFYQASGAFGFRDQLQDSVNLIWVDPALARRQILLHAAQQFIEGDTVHWFFLQQDGRTSFSSRSHACDNLLWLAWAVAEYVRKTGDETLLDETVPYLDAEVPLFPLPEGKAGMGFFPFRSSREDSILAHVRRALDLVLDKRMGKHGLPLMGTGDWNDGLDEIGSEGKGESVWMGFFLYYILREMMPLMERRCKPRHTARYRRSLESLGKAIGETWRDDRYLRAIHDDGTEIGVKGSGIWEVDALTAAWAVFAGADKERARTMFDTALRVLERDTVILLGWPALNEQTKPYLGRSCKYPEGVRENGMYCHGVQWLVGAARKLADDLAAAGDEAAARQYRETAVRLWRKISPLDHVTPDRIECYGGQPNKQAADFLTTPEPGRMIWNGYTGAAGWMLRQAIESVIGAKLEGGKVRMPDPSRSAGPGVEVSTLARDLTGSPL
jgi:cyclic beta-1,2-glucan synthetase